MVVLQRVVFSKRYSFISVFSISTPVTLRMQRVSSRFFAAQLSLMSSLVDRHNVRSLALNIVMKPGPTVELRWLKPFSVHAS